MYNILIVGGNGFIGHNVIEKFLGLNWNVYSLNLNFHNLNSKYTNITELVCDVRDLAKLKNILRNYEFEYVINCLGYVDHSKLNDGGLGVIQTHFLGTVNLIYSLNRARLKKFLRIGSSDEYGHSSFPQKESFSENPITCYAFSKKSVSDFLKMMFKSESFPSIVLRIFLVYGPNQNKNRFIPQIIKGCQENLKFPVSKGEQVRDFCYISDVVDAIYSALVCDISNAEVFNIASGNPVKIKDVVLMIKQIIGKGLPQFGMLNYRDNEIMNLYGNVDKAKTELNWYPKVSLKEGLEKTIKFSLP
jgi:UDP-glucose 4-epimerase